MQQVETDPSGQYIRYEDVLGHGSYKVVYKGFDTHEATEVAWNKLQVDKIPQSQFSKVELEVELLQRLDHKNIINLFHSWRGTDSNRKPTLDFITELMSSGTLKEYLTRARAMKLKVIRRWCHNLLEAISYLHSQKPPVMHRDLKCDNIFINGHVGEVKIGDLGLSGVKEDTIAQSVIGTPEFMAPELYEEAYTEKVDVYAFGMCMLEMISMEYPYSECENPAQIFRKVFSGQRPLSFERMPQSEIKQVIGACLERERRRPSARQLLEHPFFSQWALDDGMETNVSLASHPSPKSLIKHQTVNRKVKSGARREKREKNVSPKHSFDDLKVGQSLCFNSGVLNRDVLVMKERKGRDFQETQIEVTSGEGELLISLKIPVDGEVKKVEFFFNPDVDDVETVTCEMVHEFDLRHSEGEEIRADMEQQISEHISKTSLKVEELEMSPAFSSDEHDLDDLTAPVFAHLEQAEERLGAKSNAGSHQTIGSRSSSANYTIYLSDDMSLSKSQYSTASGSPAFDKSAFKCNMALLEHCSKGNLAMVLKKLKNGAKADFSDYDRRTPLHLAATEGHDKIVELLISQGADIDAEDRWGSTVANEAKSNGHEKVMQILAQAGAYIDTRTLSKEELHSMEMMQYAAIGFYDMVKEKLMAGAEASFADYDKRTPLHLACAEGHPDIAELLLINEADPMFRDRFGSTPMDESIKNGHDEMVDLLVKYGGCVPKPLLSTEEIEYQYGIDLVHHASCGRVGKVEHLLEVRANARFADYDKRSALHLACAEGHMAVSMLLLKAGADPDFKDRWGVSSLDEAKKNGHNELYEEMKKWHSANGQLNGDVKTESQSGDGSTVSIDGEERFGLASI